jgi:hypothetical protein
MIVNFLRGSRGSSRGRPSQRPPRFRPQFLRLEDRTLPSTYTVLTLADNGPGSLRQAITDANGHPGPDVIRFAPGVHGTIGLTSGVLNITDDLAISGPGANIVTVSGNNSSRAFSVAAAKTVGISGLTVAQGSAPTGGGIDNFGTLSLSHVILSNNQAVGGMGGGGILNEVGARLTLVDSLLTGNTATAATGSDVFGGGLLNEGTAGISGSTFSGNKAVGGNAFTFFGGSVGGGIDNFGGAALTVASSTFINNQAISAAGPFFGIGGAIENNAGFDLSTPSTATVGGSTFIGNLATGGTGATGNGGALDNEGPGATMTVSKTALIANRAVGGPGGDGVTTLSQALGGGIINFLGTLSVNNSAFVGNQAVAGGGASNAFASANGGVAGGGALVNVFTDATVTACTFVGNQAVGGDSAAGPGGIAQGGAVENSLGGTLTVSASAFSANTARGGKGAGGAVGGLGVGGAIDNYSGTGSTSTVTVATVTDTTFLGNRALGGTGGAGAAGGLGIGGAIGVGQDVLFGFPDSPTLNLGNDYVVGNLAEGGSGGAGGNGGGGWGGALGMVSGTAGVTDSTFSFNAAVGGTGGAGGNGGDGLGGGLLNNTGATLAVSGSSITFNLALGGEEGAGGSDGQGIGGGVYNLGTFTAVATVIMNNHASTSNDDCFGC